MGIYLTDGTVVECYREIAEDNPSELMALNEEAAIATDGDWYWTTSPEAAAIWWGQGQKPASEKPAEKAF